MGYKIGVTVTRAKREEEIEIMKGIYHMSTAAAAAAIDKEVKRDMAKRIADHIVSNWDMIPISITDLADVGGQTKYMGRLEVDDSHYKGGK